MEKGSELTTKLNIMKLEKLYTLSQFVDKLEKLQTVETGVMTNSEKAERLDLVFKHNAFLKKPLTKEMFVNPLTRPLLLRDFQNPTRDYLCEKEYAENMPIWEELEKKVIFKDVEIEPRALEHDLFVQKKFIARIRHDQGYAFLNVTIGALAEATNGELELQNVNI